MSECEIGELVAAITSLFNVVAATLLSVMVIKAHTNNKNKKQSDDKC